MRRFYVRLSAGMNPGDYSVVAEGIEFSTMKVAIQFHANAYAMAYFDTIEKFLADYPSVVLHWLDPSFEPKNTMVN